MAAQHRNPTNITNDSLEKIPETIAISYLPESESVSKKALAKGLNYFTQGYIHDLRISEVNGAVLVDARCWRSMRKNDSPHSLHIEIGQQKLTESYCTCNAGLNGHCSHIVGLIKSLQGLKLHNCSRVPDQQSCTSIPQTVACASRDKNKPCTCKPLGSCKTPGK
ncbi:Hypothetical predicted protein [Mytilus galloprovincialis]|uniref:SWIM-type domain-containing protein n=1 Tax=Mytilus galloprovincialis TaxID=29158 RepID=A0A8B6GD79_MYTGA|nr:Hypothetical predicted protein [Mytilus galloprovincialis]